jgi:hypothetical protein
MWDGPRIGKHLFEALGVCASYSKDKFSNVRPQFDAMTICAGQDRLQRRRSRACSLAPAQLLIAMVFIVERYCTF